VTLELVAPPDAEAEIGAHLAARLAALGDAAVVSTRIPNPAPVRIVRVIRAGGGKIDLITDAPLIILECCDDDEVAAGDLARKVRAIMFAAAPGYVRNVWCSRIHEAGAVFEPDLETLKPRYVITAEWYLQCSIL
jgi:hypothetical protein